MQFCILRTNLAEIIRWVFCNSSWGVVYHPGFEVYFCLLTFVPKQNCRCSMSFMSGDWGGHFIILTSFFLNQTFEDLDMWYGTLFVGRLHHLVIYCWKFSEMKGANIGQTYLCKFCNSFYLPMWIIFLSREMSCSLKTITLPHPNFTVCAISCASYAAPSLRRI